MRRDFRKKQNDKIIIYSVAGILTLLAIVFALLMYGNSLNNEAKKGQLSSEQIASIVKNEADSESTSSSIGKSVEEQKTNGVENNTIKNNSDTQNTIMNTTSSTNTTNKTNQTSTANSKTASSIVKQENISNKQPNYTKQNEKKELKFQMPVKGEIVREFAKDNLIFSETLQEWVTHTGIDIKAEKATVIQAAENGNIKTIKNDPRFGLTIVIEHEDGFQTVYSNLLSSEFVKEGENVTKGQSIGTVGNTAVFESADEAHLHFEIIKDSVQVDPNTYLKQ